MKAIKTYNNDLVWDGYFLMLSGCLYWVDLCGNMYNKTFRSGMIKQ